MQAAIWFRKEYAGTESKSETEKLLRQAMDDYESKKFVAKTDNLTVGELLDMWAEEELKVGTPQQWYSGKLSWCNPLYQETSDCRTQIKKPLLLNIYRHFSICLHSVGNFQMEK